MRKHIYILLFIFTISKLEAQQPASLFFMDNMPQAMQLNPANSPNCKFYLGLPLLSRVSFRYQSDIAIEDIITGNADGSTNLPFNTPELYNNFTNGLSDNSKINFDLSTNLLSFGFKMKRGYFGFSSNVRAYAETGVSSDIFRINKLTAGTQLNISQTHVNINMYKEIGFNYSYKINDRLELGIKYKFLSGLGNINTNLTDAAISIEEDQWDISLKGEINVSAPLDVQLDNDGKPEVDTYNDRLEDPLEMARYYGLSLKNPGHAFDFGAQYKLSERINLQASVLDIGWIDWSDDVSTLAFKGDYTFTGTEIDMINIDLINSDSINNIINNIADSLNNSLTYTIDSTSMYRSNLPTQIYLGGEYMLNDCFSIGLLYNAAIYNDYSRHKVVTSANYNGMSGWSMSINYTVNFNNEDKLGALVSLKLSPFQIYICAEGIPLSWQNYSYKGKTYPMANNLNGIYTQIGINMRFGCKRNKNVMFRNADNSARFPYI